MVVIIRLKIDKLLLILKRDNNNKNKILWVPFGFKIQSIQSKYVTFKIHKQGVLRMIIVEELIKIQVRTTMK